MLFNHTIPPPIQNISRDHIIQAITALIYSQREPGIFCKATFEALYRRRYLIYAGNNPRDILVWTFGLLPGEILVPLRPVMERERASNLFAKYAGRIVPKTYFDIAAADLFRNPHPAHHRAAPDE